jgi:hypothetical protein
MERHLIRTAPSLRVAHKMTRQHGPHRQRASRYLHSTTWFQASTARGEFDATRLHIMCSCRDIPP